MKREIKHLSNPLTLHAAYSLESPNESGCPDEAVRSVRIDIEYHRVLNTAEAAAFLNFSIPHFRRLYRTGGVPPPLQLSIRKLGWRVGDLIKWVPERQNRPIAD
jgi:predicted DNA-binding transcriptional regulator AlpA